ncbi:UPF0545 protein C22orf39 homolog [Macrosteles quadrilineatus]|uniref:UPF0545 protein C22orf39 homolog n=1 Tax=Macrosteles quadrilineatus TaxID=74068 RepID=UPI0023E24120|nr:UPF0545 protein C22orf39 homolog [Macrosteles quadrilineatus]
MYDDEYSDCTSIRGRFQQYFVFGKFENCDEWKHDYNNCLKWKREKDVDAAEKVIASEEARRQVRLDPHYKNPVWENRSQPPADWNKPLPAFLEEQQKDTFLYVKAIDMREGKELKPQFKICSIM